MDVDMAWLRGRCSCSPSAILTVTTTSIIVRMGKALMEKCHVGECSSLPLLCMKSVWWWCCKVGSCDIQKIKHKLFWWSSMSVSQVHAQLLHKKIFKSHEYSMISPSSQQSLPRTKLPIEDQKCCLFLTCRCDGTKIVERKIREQLANVLSFSPYDAIFINFSWYITRVTICSRAVTQKRKFQKIISYFY